MTGHAQGQIRNVPPFVPLPGANHPGVNAEAAENEGTNTGTNAVFDSSSKIFFRWCSTREEISAQILITLRFRPIRAGEEIGPMTGTRGDKPAFVPVVPFDKAKKSGPTRAQAVGELWAKRSGARQRIRQRLLDRILFHN